MNYVSNNSEILRLCKQVSDYLIGYSLPSIPVIVNIHTLSLTKLGNDPTNSTLLVMPSGYGKSTLLYDILQKSNPKWFQELPDKPFESQLLEMPDENFKDKVWVFDDLISVFRGTSTKQRDQLMGFFRTFLTKGLYGRHGNVKTGRIVCMFGLAKELIKKYSKSMFDATFQDRFMRVTFDFDDEYKREILNRKGVAQRGAINYKIPAVKLKLTKTKVSIQVPDTIRLNIESEINNLAMRIEKDGSMKAPRAQTYIWNFVKANAFINGRTEICEDDLKLFKLILPLHLKEGMNTKSIDTRIRMTILEASMNNQSITGNDIINKLQHQFTVAYIQNLLRQLRTDNVVNYQQNNGDYEYWI